MGKRESHDKCSAYCNRPSHRIALRHPVLDEVLSICCYMAIIYLHLKQHVHQQSNAFESFLKCDFLHLAIWMFQPAQIFFLFETICNFREIDKQMHSFLAAGSSPNSVGFESPTVGFISFE